jgi:hypothetical protein
MKRSSPRKTASLSESVDKQLNIYALAASAAGLGILALVQPAEAKIVYTPAHKHIAPHQSFRLDLNHDRKVDFTLINSSSCGTDQCNYGLGQKPARGNSGIGYLFNGLPLASALKRGSRIGPGGAFRKGAEVLVDILYSSGAESTQVFGAWPNVKNRYLGLKFQIHGKTHYGWARLSVKVVKTSISGTLTGYAYETIANKPIVAGRTTGTNHSDAMPGTLGNLALGRQ